MNLYKRSILFRSGEKPFCCFDALQQPETVSDLTKWHTNQVTDVQYGVYTKHTTSHTATAAKRKNLIGFSMQARKQKYYCLSFTLHFLENQKSVMLCSATPYTYRFFSDFIQQRLASHRQLLTKSLSGLDVPVLTFGQGPRIVVIVGRVHPGESHSSWVVHGVLQFLSQQSPNKLKDLLTFKIVPMINVDGVYGGNYRTSFIGKDNNRLYMQRPKTSLGEEEENFTRVNEKLLPEITAVKKLISDNRQDILTFIDVHHHCVKRGAFMYGPSA